MEAVEIQRKAGIEAVSTCGARRVDSHRRRAEHRVVQRATRDGREGLHRGEQSTGDECADGFCGRRRLESSCADDQRRHWRRRDRRESDCRVDLNARNQ